MRSAVIAVLVATALAAPPAGAASVGVVVFGGPSFPIAQDDNGTGVQYGVRLPVGLTPILGLEPYFARSDFGDVRETFAGTEYTRSGWNMNAFGVNLGLGGFGLLPGFPLHAYAGIGSHSLSRVGSEDVTEVGYNFGLRFALPLPSRLSLDVRGELNVVDLGDTSRKFIHATANLGYSFSVLP